MVEKLNNKEFIMYHLNLRIKIKKNNIYLKICNLIKFQEGDVTTPGVLENREYFFLIQSLVEIRRNSNVILYIPGAI